MPQQRTFIFFNSRHFSSKELSLIIYSSKAFVFLQKSRHFSIDDIKTYDGLLVSKIARFSARGLINSSFEVSKSAVCVSDGKVLCKLATATSAPHCIASTGKLSEKGKCAPCASSTSTDTLCKCAILLISSISDTAPS